MPIQLEPDQAFEIVLDSDKSKPSESRPLFIVKSQSMRGQRRLIKTLDRILEDGFSTDTLFTETASALSDVLLGWKNMNGIEYSADKIEDVLAYSEARELLRKVVFNSRVSDDEKKASA